MFTPEYIINLIRSRSYDCLAIFSYDGSKQIDWVKGKPDDLVAAFETFCEGAKAGSFRVDLYVDGKQSGSGAKTDENRRRQIPFRVDSGSGGVTGGDANLSVNYDEIMRLNLEISNMKFEQRLQEIEAGNSNRALGMMENILLKLSGGHTKVTSPSGPPAISGGEDATSADVDELNEILDRWQTRDPNFFDNLKMLVDLAGDDPDTYKQAVLMLQAKSK